MTRHSKYIVKELYSLGGFTFDSAKELAEFKNYSSEWDSVKSSPLSLSGISVETYQDFLDYVDSLRNMPDICLAYRADNARGYGYYTTVWCNSIEVRGIFGYLESEDIKDHLVFETISLSKWKGMKIRTKLCR